MRLASMKRMFAVLLVLCLLVVGSAASAQSISHESHHAHHQQSTHSTVLCAWMCAAGQVLDSVTTPALIELAPVSLIELPALTEFSSTSSSLLTSRGPPNGSTL
jgi:hypothetical protein